jgi:hypothetical protein
VSDAAAPAVRVAAEAPAGWGRVAFGPPDLSQSPQVALVDWSAWGPPDGAPTASARLVTACFEAKTTTWTPEAEPLVLDKIAQVATSTALRLAPVGPLHVVGTDRTGDLVSQRLEGSFEHGWVGSRTFLGFQTQTQSVVACFALCVDDAARDGCASSLRTASMVGQLGAPPSEGLGLRVTMAAVHHPRTAATLAVLLAALGAVLAVATRRRPRVR